MNYFFDTHTHLKQNIDNVISIVNIQPNTPPPKLNFSVGIHPWCIHEFKIDTIMDKIAEFAKNRYCVAIGESGLDKINYNKTEKLNPELKIKYNDGYSIQKIIFQQQIEIANFANKPMIIHCVKAFPELISIRKKITKKTPWIIHGFNSSLEIAKSLIKEEIFLSFGSKLTSPNSHKLRATFKEIPLEKILLETDNLEKRMLNIEDIYNKAAEIKAISVDNLKSIILKNIQRAELNIQFEEK